MARESQGLQIALIIFFMLTIVLGVTTFLYHGKYVDAQKLAEANEGTATENGRLLAGQKTESAELKQMIGLADKPLSDVKDQFGKDKATYGKGLHDAELFWSPMLARLWEANKDHETDITALTTKLKDLQLAFDTREKTKDDQIKKLDAAVKEAGERLAAITSAFNDQRRAFEALGDGFKQKVDQIFKDSTAKTDKAAQIVKLVEAQATKIKTENEKLEAELRKFDRPVMDHPLGSVTFVDQGLRTVWINLGRADALDRQIRFSVYSADAMDLGKAQIKATVEVTAITGDHEAEARIIDDKVADPILPGDRVFTRLWSPGDRQHFALAGVMNIDGDGRNAVAVVRNLIRGNGGDVDCWMDESGNKNGEVTFKTRWLVRGDDPKDGKQFDAMTKIVRDAARVDARTITLSELKQQVDYKPGTVGVQGARPGAAAAAPRAAAAAQPVAKPVVPKPVAKPAAKKPAPKTEDEDTP
jgi:hypothetical protein